MSVVLLKVWTLAEWEWLRQTTRADQPCQGRSAPPPRSTTLALGAMVSKLFVEKCRRGFEPAQMAGLHEHDRTLNADAGPPDSLQPPALRMRGEKSRRDKPEADPARDERHLHVDIVDCGGDFERRAELAQPRLE